MRTIPVVAVGTVVVSIGGWLAAVACGDATIEHDRPYVWRSGSAIFLANSAPHPVDCAIVHDGQTGTVRLPAGDGFSVRGARIGRRSAAPETVTCDEGVTVSAGPRLALYRLASWPPAVPLGLTVPALIGLYRWRERNGLATANRLGRGPLR